MPHYISLFRYTQKGVESLKEGPARLDAAKKALEAAGGKLLGFYLTLGRYDAVAIAEFPDDATAAKVVLGGAMQGSVRSETLRAFTEGEYRRIIASIS
jgi:uncharacterized protein with GYD domain